MGISIPVLNICLSMFTLVMQCVVLYRINRMHDDILLSAAEAAQDAARLRALYSAMAGIEQ